MAYQVKKYPVVLPGDLISSESGFLRGHGTYMVEPEQPLTGQQLHRVETKGYQMDTDEEVEEEDEEDEEDEGMSEEEEMHTMGQRYIVSSVAGVVSRINNLIQVKSFKSRYIGEVGDVVIGRIIEVESKRWKVDLNTRQSGILHLGSINLPGGILRRRTAEDSLQIRDLFTEQDLISAEVSKSENREGRVSLHTRSLKYGKLENGVLVEVSHHLMKRVKNHFVNLKLVMSPSGAKQEVESIFGLNGLIWLTMSGSSSFNSASKVVSSPSESAMDAEIDRDIEAVERVEETKDIAEMERKKKLHALKTFPVNERKLLAIVRNVIVLLNKANRLIAPETVELVAQKALSLHLDPKQILSPAASKQLIE